ncbi:MAG: metal ABC transporter ATP-binding protein [Candidatus Bipolaricaulota bacterium]
MGTPVIELNDVDTVYEGERFPAIRNIDLQVDCGEFSVVLGPNGVGKTTLLETINGLLSPTRGEVKVFGKDVQRFGEQIRKKIGYIPQDVSFDPLTPFLVKNVVLMGRYGKIGLIHRPQPSDWERARWALEQVGIREFEGRPIGKLSGGQQQKVLIARMVAKDPSIMLLDEPFSNLDFVAVEEISDLICTLHDELSLTTAMVLHNLESIPSRCNRLILMGEGSIARTGDPDLMLNSDVLNAVY